MAFHHFIAIENDRCNAELLVAVGCYSWTQSYFVLPVVQNVLRRRDGPPCSVSLRIHMRQWTLRISSDDILLGIKISPRQKRRDESGVRLNRRASTA